MRPLGPPAADLAFAVAAEGDPFLNIALNQSLSLSEDFANSTQRYWDFVVGQLDSGEPAAVVDALLGAQFLDPSNEAEQAFVDRAIALMEDPDPIVRGSAFDPFNRGVRLEGYLPRLLPLAQTALADESAYVRGQAIGVFGVGDDVDQIPHILPLLDDRVEDEGSGSIRYPIGPDDTEIVQYGFSGRSIPAEAVLSVLEEISSLTEVEFEAPDIDSDTLQEDLEAAAEAARAWWAENEAALRQELADD